MLVIPTQPIANQTLQVQLNGQACTLNVYQQAYGLYVDVFVGATLIIEGVIGLNGNLIVRSEYLGFSGDLEFIDTQGTDDPIYTGLGTRWQLLYLTPDDIAAANLAAGVE